MKKIFLFILVFLITLKNTSAQTYVGSTTQSRNSKGNLILNSGFEAHDGQGYPDYVGQTDKMASWESKTYIDNTITPATYEHSPDWIYTGTPNSGSNSLYQPFPTPASGRGIVGMGNYELLQQNFKNEDLIEGEFYIVSMYIYLYSSTPTGTTSNSSLKCYLANHDVAYKKEKHDDACTKEYTEHVSSGNETKEIASWNLNLQNYPNTNGWTKISKVFRAPKNHNYWDYFVIEIQQNNFNPSTGQGYHCNDGYVFIDEVSVEEVDQCGKTCSPALAAIQYTTMPDAIVANNIPGFTMLVKNAMGINFTVFDSWGQEIYNQNAYDPNGLVDSGYPDYYFSWTGQKPDGSLFPEDVYVYTLRLWNCSYDQTYAKSLTYIIGNGSATQGYDFHNTQLANCCPNYLEIQNKGYFSGVTVEKAHNYILAGKNINATPIGPVICHSGSNVKYVSKLITLANGFSVAPGGKFTAIITGICSDQLIRSRDVIRDRSDFTTLTIDSPHNIENVAYTISPNPSNDGIFKLFFNVENNSIENIELYDPFGKLIQSNNHLTSSLAIDLSNYSRGLYFLKIKFKNSPSIKVEKLINN